LDAETRDLQGCRHVFSNCVLANNCHVPWRNKDRIVSPEGDNLFNVTPGRGSCGPHRIGPFKFGPRPFHLSFIARRTIPSLTQHGGRLISMVPGKTRTRPRKAIAVFFITCGKRPWYWLHRGSRVAILTQVSPQVCATVCFRSYSSYGLYKRQM